MEESSRFHPSPGAVPTHVGIIPDGGRRWALAHGKTLSESYARTRLHLKTWVEFLLKKEIREITIYLSSIQNFKRDPAELKANLELVEASLKEEITVMAKEKNLRVIVSGQRQVLPETMVKTLFNIEQQTAGYNRGRLNFLLAYDPLAEIINAFRESGDPARFFNHLRITTPVDLVIRSGGAPVLSNFLPLQSAYARLFFSDKLFNDFEIVDLEMALENFGKTDRKFGE